MNTVGGVILFLIWLVFNVISIITIYYFITTKKVKHLINFALTIVVGLGLMTIYKVLEYVIK